MYHHTRYLMPACKEIVIWQSYINRQSASRMLQSFGASLLNLFDRANREEIAQFIELVNATRAS